MSMKKTGYGHVIDLEKYVNDGRMTEPSDGKRYAWRDMIQQVKLLGRPLTSKEQKFFER